MTTALDTRNKEYIKQFVFIMRPLNPQFSYATVHSIRFQSVVAFRCFFSVGFGFSGYITERLLAIRLNLHESLCSS